MRTAQPSDSIWTRAFALLCLVEFLGYAQQYMLTPIFPLYITHLGGSPFVVGLVLFSFAATSVISRPFIGYWSDRWSECGVLVFGLVILAASILFCFLPFVGTILIANGLRGIGWGGLNTGGYALLARIAPESRRGEASGYYSGAQSCGTIMFPAIALWLLDAAFGGFAVVFAAAIAVALAGASVTFIMGRELSSAAHSARQESPTLWRREIFNLLERDVLLPAALLFCSQLTLPAITSFIVLYARELGIDAIGSYFVISGIASVLARPLLGHVSDRIGPAHSLIATFVLQSAALLLLVFVSSLAGILLAGVLYMLGMAIGVSATLILAMKRATAERRGRFMASFSVAYPLGYGLGAFITGSAVDALGFAPTYLLLALLGTFGLVLTIVNWPELKS